MGLREEYLKTLAEGLYIEVSNIETITDKPGEGTLEVVLDNGITIKYIYISDKLIVSLTDRSDFETKITTEHGDCPEVDLIVSYAMYVDRINDVKDAFKSFFEKEEIV